MKRTKDISKSKLFIEELERPAMAGVLTTLVVGEEGGKWGPITTLAIGEEGTKFK